MLFNCADYAETAAGITFGPWYQLSDRGLRLLGGREE
jgi:hypothetical protein